MRTNNHIHIYNKEYIYNKGISELYMCVCVNKGDYYKIRKTKIYIYIHIYMYI